MRKIKEVIRLKFEADLSHERIAAATGVSKGAVTKYLQRAREVELGWPLPPAMDDAKLEALLFPRAPPLVTRHIEPDFGHLHQELMRKGVTLQLLWEEYAVAHPGQAYRYSQFCLLFKRFHGSLKRSMRQVHRAPVTNYSSTTPATRSPSSTAPPAKSATSRSSSRCWARRAMCMPKRRGPSSCPIGSLRTSAASNS